MHGRARILVQVTTYRRWRIVRDGHPDQFDTYDIYEPRSTTQTPPIIESGLTLKQHRANVSYLPCLYMG